jgi:hypothetical protein
VTDFELEDDEYHLFFEDPKYNGLEVVMADMSLEDALELDEARFAVPETIADIKKQARTLAELIGERLVSWNLTKKGVAVPADAKGLLQQKRGFLDAVVGAYVQALRGVPAPLALGSSDTGSSSNDGSPSDQVPPIPMEPLSEPQ